VINTLLPVSINASTQQGLTYFYVITKHKKLFAQVVDYLYAGLTQYSYSHESLLAERDGVLVNELTLLEHSPDYARDAAIRRIDDAPMAYRHAGGYSDLMAYNTMEQVIAYKQKWYQPNQITALFSGPSADISKLINPVFQSRSDGRFTFNKFSSSGDAALLPLITYGEMEKRQTVSTWWFPSVYKTELHQYEQALRAQTEHLGEVYIDPETNHQDAFALRFIHNEDNHDIGALKDALSVLCLDEKPSLFDDPKLPCEVNYLIQQYHNQSARKAVRTKSFSAYLDNHHQSFYAPIIGKGKVIPQVQFNNTPSRIATQNSELLSIANLPSLPRSLNKLAAQTTQSVPFAKHIHNWTFQVPTTSYPQLLGKLVSPSFWYPRTRGECYSLGAARYNNHVFIYGAQDVFSKNREQWCMEVIGSSDIFG
jgi:hypothetical protein